MPVLGEDGAGESVVGGTVDGLANLSERVGSGVIVDVGDEDGAEELAAEERVDRVGGGVDGRVDVVALAAVVLAADEQLELRVVLGLVNDAREFLEGTFVDDRAAEVGEVRGVANLQGRGLGDKNFLDDRPEGLGSVETGGSAALLALVLEGTPYRLLGSIFDVGGRMDKVEVLATGLANNARVALVGAIGNTGGDLAIQATENLGTSSEVKSGKFPVTKNYLGDFLSITWHELDDAGRQTGLKQDLVEQPVGGHGGRGRFPDNNITHQCGSAREVAGDGGEVEGSDGIDETLERAVLNAVPNTWSVVHGLGSEGFLGVLDVEPEEVAQLCSRVDLSLPCVLALAQHGGRHDIVSILGRDEVGSLEEDRSAVSEGEGLPSRLSLQSGVNGGSDIGGSGIGEACDGVGVRRGVVLGADGGRLDL